MMKLKVATVLMKFKKIVLNHYYFLTPFLLFLSFPFSENFPLFPLFAHFAFIPLFSKMRGNGFRKNLIICFSTGVISFLLLNSWMRKFGAGASGGEAVILLALIPALSAQFALKCAITEKLASYNERFRLIIFPGVWLFFDFISNLGFIAFPWNFLGYSQYPLTSYIQTASIGGVYAVTFAVLFSNIIFTDLMLKRSMLSSLKSKDILISILKKIRPVIVLNCVIILFGIVRLNLPKEEASQKKMKFAIVQNCQNPWDNWIKYRYQYLNDHLNFSQRVIEENPDTDMIVWSESATLEPVSYQLRNGQHSKFVQMISDYARQQSKYILTGEIGKERPSVGETEWYNSACLIAPDGTLAGYHYKTHLAPVGEWFPYAKWFPSFQEYLYSMGSSDFTPGKSMKIFKAGDYSFFTAICYESIFAGINRKFPLEGADFAVVITNDGWSDSYQGHYQHFSSSVFRAVETGLWYVRAGNSGKSALINPEGKITAEMPILKRGSFAAAADFSENRKTLYSKFGDSFLFLYFFACIMLLIFSLIKTKLAERGR
ncbi:MAG TPA: apolipoprotein N-acyltransferase [Spirochaetota bacterium]|nr:apolipoprotein N-acyltransferase [Spirochaetota bacterium]